MGVLTSNAFEAWARDESSTLEERLRFTPSTAFETFPWPTPTPKEREDISEAANILIRRRQEISLRDKIGLTELYNRMDDGAYVELIELHNKLNAAVVSSYGWPTSIAKEPLKLLLKLGELNQQKARYGGTLI
jgi:hypothetical protein